MLLVVYLERIVYFCKMKSTLENMTCIHSAKDLITSHEQTRTGFIEAAMAKNIKAKPYIEQAKTLKSIAQTVKSPTDLIDKKEIYSALLSAAGLSDKSFKYFTDEDKEVAIRELIDKFLVPAGDSFADELVYRFLLIKGDSLGGSMRNYVGTVAQMKLVRKILSVLSIQSIDYKVLMHDGKRWREENYETAFEMAENIKGIVWKQGEDSRLLLLNAKIPIVNNNVDLSLFDGDEAAFDGGRIVQHDELALMFGELKGGVDPAGADEHWKTGNTALERIRNAFPNRGIKTSFIAACIEAKMAEEIFAQLENNTLSKAANMSVDEQLTEYSQWLIAL